MATPSPMDIAGLLGGLGGGIGNAQQQRWENDFAINLLNRSDAAFNRGYEDWLRQMTPIMYGAQQAGAGAQARIFEPGTSGGNLDFALANLWDPTNPYNSQNIMSQYGGQYNTPTTQEAQWNLNNLGNNDSQMAGVGRTAAAGFQGGGWTPQRQQYLDQLAPLMSGMSPSQQQQLMSGMGLMQNGGANGTTQQIMDRANEAVMYGGYTPQLEGLIQNLAGIAEKGGATQGTQFGNQASQGLINSGGYDPAINSLLGSANRMFTSGGRTPQIDAGSNIALGGLGTGGRTDVSAGLGDIGLDLLSREALMSPQQAASFAMDSSGAASKNAFEAAQRRANARGGGPGNVVAAGNSTGAMADYADEIAENQSQALREAMLAQQGLQLQQRGLGAQAASGAGGLENSRMGLYGDLLGSMENAATQKMNSAAGMAGSALGTAANRLGTGFNGLNDAQSQETQRLLQALGLVTGAQNAATQRAGTIGGLGLNADQNNISRMGLGANLLQGYTGSQQNAMNGLNNFIGNQDQYALGLGGLANSSSTGQANILNQLFGNEQQAAQMGLNRAGMYGGLSNNMFNNAQAGNNMYSNLLQGSWNPLVNMAGQANDMGRTGLGNLSLSSAPRGGGNASVWSSMVGGLK